MTVTIAEFKMNLDKYLTLAETEDVHISKNGKVTVKLVRNNQDKVSAMQSLFGCIPADITVEDAGNERLKQL